MVTISNGQLEGGGGREDKHEKRSEQALGNQENYSQGV